MQAMLGGGDSVSSMQPGRTSDGHHVHRTVPEKTFQFLIGLASELRAKLRHFLLIGSEHGGDFRADNRLHRARMRLADVSAANQADMNRHISSRSLIHLPSILGTCFYDVLLSSPM